MTGFARNRVARAHQTFPPGRAVCGARVPIAPGDPHHRRTPCFRLSRENSRRHPGLDGTCLHRSIRSVPRLHHGEVVFNTAITGHQEILTDPSYCRQIVTLTHPHIGNVGVNGEDIEAAASRPRPGHQDPSPLVGVQLPAERSPSPSTWVPGTRHRRRPPPGDAIPAGRTAHRRPGGSEELGPSIERRCIPRPMPGCWRAWSARFMPDGIGPWRQYRAAALWWHFGPMDAGRPARVVSVRKRSPRAGPSDRFGVRQRHGRPRACDYAIEMAS